MYKFFLKRAIDVFFSFFALIVLFPLFLVMAFLIIIFTGFPVFFVQDRPGYKERVFKMYKFKTMNSKVDISGQLLPDKYRITRIGSFLRKYSLDELPELVNVLLGDMSLIGPRPLLVKYLPYYTEREKTRHDVRPGITGLAQVSGRNSVDWATRLELDAQYVKTISLWLDVKILLHTIGAVFLSKGVSVDSGAIEPSLIDYRNKKNSIMNMLFTCAGRRNYLLQYFKDVIGNQGKIIAADMQHSAPAMAVADVAIQVPAVYADNYIDSILEICKKEKVDALFSLNDLELPILSARKEEFKKLGVKLIVSDERVIDTCFDKWKTKQFADSIGMAIPQTYIDYHQAINALKEDKLSFPLVVKPRWGSASIGLEFPTNEKELELAYQLLTLRLFRSSLAEASQADPEHAILIQEKIEGKEYGIDILNDFSGKPQQVYVKEKLAMRAGETDKSVLRNKPEIEAIGFKIGDALGHIGNLDCDIFEIDGKYYLLEMNPRFGGGYPFTHMAGGNYPAALISWLKGDKFDFSTFRRNYDQVFSKCDTLIPVKSDT